MDCVRPSIRVGAFLGPLLAVALMFMLASDMRAVFWMAVLPAGLAVLLVLFGVKDHVSHDQILCPSADSIQGHCAAGQQLPDDRCDWRRIHFGSIQRGFSDSKSQC